MNKIILAAVLATFSGAVLAYSNYARVVDVTTEYREVIVTQCSTPRYNSYSYNLPGAIVGGVLGHQFGHGRGRDAATAYGAILGSRSGGYRQECYPVRELKPVGYNYTAELDGQYFSGFSPSWVSPGDLVQVRAVRNFRR